MCRVERLLLSLRVSWSKGSCGPGCRTDLGPVREGRNRVMPRKSFATNTFNQSHFCRFFLPNPTKIDGHSVYFPRQQRFYEKNPYDIRRQLKSLIGRSDSSLLPTEKLKLYFYPKKNLQQLPPNKYCLRKVWDSHYRI